MTPDDACEGGAYYGRPCKVNNLIGQTNFCPIWFVRAFKNRMLQTKLGYACAMPTSFLEEQHKGLVFQQYSIDWCESTELYHLTVRFTLQSVINTSNCLGEYSTVMVSALQSLECCTALCSPTSSQSSLCRTHCKEQQTNASATNGFHQIFIYYEVFVLYV